MYDDRPLRCPYCGGIHLFHQKRGFSFRNAFIGNMFFGENGFLAGFLGYNRTEITCRDCGYTWEE
ncbi:MAG: hypothetical protein K2H74_00880 [Paramuribaculum sp.]|nr:hypothetical protein [Paramuribaculum sp.]